MKNPIQPLCVDDRGVLRFKANAIVRHLLDHGGLDMNHLARIEFSQSDREQFAQLIGYSHSGAGDLGYVSDETWSVALTLHDDPQQTELRARIAFLETKLADARELLRPGVVALFNIHPDDLDGRP